jgi:hypothetical protein
MRTSCVAGLLTLAFILLPTLSRAEDLKEVTVANAGAAGSITTNADRNSSEGPGSLNLDGMNLELNALKKKNKKQAELLEVGRRKEAELQEKIKKAGSVPPAAKDAASNKPKKPTPVAHPDDFSTYQSQLLKDLGYSQETKPVPPKTAASNGCTTQPLFIRSDSLDNYLYGATPASKAKGASISYTDDRQKELQTLTINGMMSYVVASNLCLPTPGNDVPFISGYAIAPFVNAQGNLTQPEAKTERSALTFGTEAEFELSQFIIPRQVFTIAPFYQTDFRDIARIDGVSAFWDIFDPNLHLGGYVSTTLEPDLGWFLQIRGETDVVKVSTPGLTNLTKSDYAWTGGTARLNLFFFPYETNVPEFLRNRFSFVATVAAFHDVNSGQNIVEYTAALAYKITTDGSGSISLEYDRGTDRATLNFLNQYLVKLTYAL